MIFEDGDTSAFHNPSHADFRCDQSDIKIVQDESTAFITVNSPVDSPRNIECVASYYYNGFDYYFNDTITITATTPVGNPDEPKEYIVTVGAPY